MNAWEIPNLGPFNQTFAAKWGGAVFNLYDGLHDPSSAFKGSVFYGYDDPRDFEAIEFGAQLYARRHPR